MKRMRILDGSWYGSWIEYKKFKDSSEWLGEKYETQSNIFSRAVEAPVQHKDISSDSLDVSIFDLLDALKKALARCSEEAEVPEIVAERFTVGDMMSTIKERLLEKGSIQFDTLFEDFTNRREIATTFLALLELIKRKAVRIQQSETFGPIEISGVDEPSKAEGSDLPSGAGDG